MIELLIGLFLLALFGAGVVLVFVLPIVAFRRSGQVVQLEERLLRLEREVQQLRRARPPAEELPLATTAEPATAEPAAPQAVPPPTVVERTAAIPSRGRTAEVAGSLPYPPVDLEAWIGRHGLGWVAVVLLLFAVGFFIQQVFENRWVGELGRVAIGVVLGISLCLLGLRFHRRGWRVLSQMATAGGVAILYLATFGSFGYYHLIPRDQAAIFLILLVVESAALAVLYDAPAIALMAIIGGLLTPILLRSDHDQYRSLFTYLLILNAGVAGVALFRRWPALGTVALIGTQALFWGWYQVNYHPEKLGWAIGFQTALFVLFLSHSLRAHVVRRRTANLEDLVRLVLNGFLFAVAAYVLLDDAYHVWMGSLMIGLAIVYTALGGLVMRLRPDDQRQLLVVVAVGLAFLAMVFPLQADAAWIAVGWAVEGLALWWFGLRISAKALCGMGLVLLVLAAGRLVFVDTPYTGRGPFIPIFNKYGLPASAVIACGVAAAISARQYRARLGDLQGLLVPLLGLASVGLIWFLLSVETYTYFLARIAARGEDVTGRHRLPQAALSSVWAAYAAIILGIGFYWRSLPLRWAALGLFGLTLAKVVLFDMAELPGFYRVATFFVLALMLAAGAWGYQKFPSLRQGTEQEGA